MKKLFAAFCCLVGLTVCGQGKGLLWKITSAGQQKPSYLYGTVHITCDATLSDATKKALSETDQLFLELDMDDPAMQTRMLSLMTMKDGKTLKSLLSPEDFTLLNDYMTKNVGIPATMFNTAKPFMISALFYPKMIDCPLQSVEGELMALNSADKKEVYGLEKLEDQMAIFDKIPYEVQLAELMKSIRNDFANDKTESKKLYETYASADLDAMYKLTIESDNKIMSEYEELLLNNRNRNWIPVIESEIAKKPTFFGVGAAHLAGPNGVISLLRKAGYTVEAVK